MKFGFFIGGSYREKPLNEACNHLKQLGYDCVEFHSDIHFDELDMEISEIVVQRDLIVLDEAERMENIDYTVKCIEKCAKQGINTINIFTGPVPWLERPLIIDKDIKAGTAWDMVFDAFDKLIPVAEKHGVSLALENVWGMLCNDFFTAQYLVNSINSPALGVNYDPSHDILAGNFDVGWIIRQWGERIKHVHLKDAVGIGKMGQFVFPLLGEGLVDWKAFFTALKDIGYNGACSVEFESYDYLKNILNGSMEEAAKISMDTIDNYFRRLL